MKNKKAFTLVELLAVIAIIAIIAAVATPNVIKMIENSNKEEILTDAKIMISKAKYKFRTDIDTNPSGKAYFVSELIDNDEKNYDATSYVQTGITSGAIVYSVYLKNDKCEIAFTTEEDLNLNGQNSVNCN